MPVASDLALAPATRLLALLGDGELTARGLTELYLERIARLDPALNAYRTVRREAALAEADAADARRRAGEQAPLLGLPVAVKDNLEVAGELTTHGTGLVREPARQDCEAVRRLRAAGAIVLSLTTMPELALWPHATDSPTWGVTRNPHDPSRSPGGSSGGSAVAVARAGRRRARHRRRRLGAGARRAVRPRRAQAAARPPAPPGVLARRAFS
jgi:amidase